MFVQHTSCPAFPCHRVNVGTFNCFFCFCPLYHLENCGGLADFMGTDGLKDCSKCTLPHEHDGYRKVLSKLREVYHKGHEE
jgi:hypothetical protein